jgi:hypothetical protein
LKENNDLLAGIGGCRRIIRSAALYIKGMAGSRVNYILELLAAAGEKVSCGDGMFNRHHVIFISVKHEHGCFYLGNNVG